MGYKYEDKHPELQGGSLDCGYEARIDQLKDDKAWDICRSVLEPLLANRQVRSPQATTRKNDQVENKVCKVCKVSKPKDAYSKNWWGRKKPKCIECVAAKDKKTTLAVAKKNNQKFELRNCSVCKKSKPRNEYSNRKEWKKKLCTACKSQKYNTSGPVPTPEGIPSKSPCQCQASTRAGEAHDCEAEKCKRTG